MAPTSLLSGAVRQNDGKERIGSYLPILGITEDTTPEILSWLQSLTDSLISISAPSPISLVIALRWRIFHSLHHSLPTFGEIRARHYIEDNPDLLRWMHAVQDSPSLSESFSEEDHVAETLHPILRHQREVQFPILQETFHRVHAKATATDFDGKLPRSLGTTEITIGGASAHRRVLVMNQWEGSAHIRYACLLHAG